MEVGHHLRSYRFSGRSSWFEKGKCGFVKYDMLGHHNPIRRGFVTTIPSWAVVPVTTRSLDALVRAVSNELKKKVAYKLWDLVKEIGEKGDGVVSSEMLNVLISLFSRLGKGMAGFEVFNKFGDLGCVTNADTYYYTVQALCRRSIYERVGLVCERMISEEKLPEAGKVGDIIYYLCKGGMVKEAYSVYLSAKGKQRYPPQSPVNFLITSLCDRKKNNVDSVHFALKMLDDLQNQKYAIKQFACVIQGLCRVNDIEGAKALLSRMIDNGPPPGNAIFNTIINALSKSGDLTEAIKVMRLMENRGLKPDVFAYSVIMSGYIKGGEMEEAAKMLTEAKKNHCKLTPVIYHTIIRGYCKLEQFEKAVKLLEEMEEYGVRPNTDEYNKLIQSLCLKAADWVMAEKLMEEMTKRGLHLNGITKSLIRAVKELEEEGKGAKETSVAA
ncbi:small ribosomal subunit protein mS80 (rPPR6)-like [Bidens hawaiensis]|uniref:small ribosomal subunit protein mS80 (rPPR6)-like n=1 Tax=Bidens hawaiensis TaxID=980011 RepID=UPI00404A2F08